MAVPCLVAKSNLARKVQGMKEYPLSERFVAGVKTGYLATATSRIKHISSVALTQGYRGLVEQPAAVGVDYIMAVGKSALNNDLGNFQKYRTTTNLLNPRAVKLIGKAGFQGLNEAVQAVKAGIDPERVANAFDVGRVQFKNPLLRAIQRRVDVMVTATNKPFFAMSLQASLVDQAQVLDKIDGLGVDWHLAHLTDEMSHRALDEATYSTFNDNGPIAKGISKWKNEMRKIRDAPTTLQPSERALAQAHTEGLRGAAAHEYAGKLMALTPKEFSQRVTVSQLSQEAGRSEAARGTAAAALVGAELLVPFARIGLNLGEAGVKMTPLGVPYAFVQALQSKSGRVLVDGIVKAGAGTASLVALGYHLRSQGIITGEGPTTPGGRNVQTAAGDQSYSVKIGKTAHRYDWVEPLSFGIALGADLYDQLQATPDNKLGAFGRAEGQNIKMLTTKGILGSFAQVEQITQLNAKAAIRYITSVLSVPPLISQVARGTDPVRDRETQGGSMGRTLVNEFKAKIPGLRETLPERVDVLGQTARKPEGVLGAVTDPSNPSYLRDDPLIKEMQAVGARISIVKRDPGESPKAYQERSQQFGKEARQAIEEVLSSPDYEQADQDAEWLIANEPKYQGKSSKDVTRQLRRGLIEGAVRRARSGLNEDRKISSELTPEEQAFIASEAASK